eukprot:scaffold186605_cov16-Tisochrysis_lutea.AAC.2
MEFQVGLSIELTGPCNEKSPRAHNARDTHPRRNEENISGGGQCKQAIAVHPSRFFHVILHAFEVDLNVEKSLAERAAEAERKLGIDEGGRKAVLFTQPPRRKKGPRL